jgi:hypothetical protein
MDGVLADFFAEYAKLAGVTSGNYRDIPPAKADPTLDKMVGTDFFMRLPKFPTADSLVKLALSYGKVYNICSSPLRGDFKNSEHWKREWIKANLNPQPVEIIITGQKERHAVNPDGSPNILIDDRGTNIVAWRARGGIGIKYQADEDSLDKVAQALELAYGDTMKSNEFVQKESALDDMVDQAKQSKTTSTLPYNQSKVGNFIGKTVAGAANLAGRGVKGLGGALGAGFDKSMTSGHSFGGIAGGGSAFSGIPYQTNNVDPKVADYLKKAAKGQPLKQATGNPEFDTMLKNAGLLK